MNSREKQKIISIIEIAQAGVEQSKDKVQRENPEDITRQYLEGEYAAYEAVLHFLKTGCTADFMLWCNSRQRILIDDINENRIKP